MNHIIRILLTVIVFLCIAASNNHAQLGDGNRAGFQLGAGGVIGHTSISYSGGGSDDALSFGANLYIGYGLSDQSILSFRYRYTWIDTESPYQGLLWSADYRHYLSDKGRFYLSGGFGPAMSIPEFGDPKSGFGFYGGVGYEITKYIYLNADFTYTSLSDNLSGTAILASVSFIKY